MTLTNDSLAVGIALFGKGAQNRVQDPALRALVTTTVASHRAASLARAESVAYDTYSASDVCGISHRHTRKCAKDCTRTLACGKCRACQLQDIHWPRAARVKNAIAECKSLLRRHSDRHDDMTLTTYEYDGVIIRQIRLEALLTLSYGRARAVGMFPIVRDDMRMSRTRFLRSAAYRHFTFKGGRDESTIQIDPADILQGAFCRAIETITRDADGNVTSWGDTVNGVPAYGTLYRHIQAERASLTRVSLAESAALMRVLHGDVPAESREWPEMTDKHNVRKLGTRNYATLSQHRQSLAIAHRDAELANIDDAVTNDARKSVLPNMTENFASWLAGVLMEGHTVAGVALAFNMTERAITDRALAERSSILSSGIDHSQRSADMIADAERERAQDDAERKHAERCRRMELDRAIDVYAHNARYSVARGIVRNVA